ncbi:MAG: hypothetical protein GF400_06745 [Candidatus Eisenbacteria bacterium]|nr:hypothetical protein [Candidatus Eisenbacteria bacterium]
MRGELVRFEAEDGLELVGFYAAPEGGGERAVLHTHGLAGNFYENRFVSAVASAVVEKGLAFLTCNNRGHDYRSDNLQGEGVSTEVRLGGSSFDIFDESVLDIGGGAAFLEARGHAEIYFEGHSLGANKVAHYLAERRDPRAAGAVLISPPDMFGLREESLGGAIDEVVAHARDLVERHRGQELLETGYVVPFSARTIVGLYGDPGKTDIFPFRHGHAGDYSVLDSLELPILATFGTVEEAVTISPSEAAALMRRESSRARRIDVQVIEGANHAYFGFEETLADAIASFVAA